MTTTIATLERDVLVLSERLTASDRAAALRSDMEQKAIDAALATLNGKLRDMNEFRGALSDLTAQMVTRKESDANFGNMNERFFAELKAVDNRLAGAVAAAATRSETTNARIDSAGRTNWPLIVSLLTGAAALVAGTWAIIGLKIDASLSPTREVMQTMANQVGAHERALNDTTASVTKNAGVVQTLMERSAVWQAFEASASDRLHTLERDVAAQAQFALESRSDRSQINFRLGTLETRFAKDIAEGRTAEAVIRAKLAEIETQFRSLSIVINLSLDHGQRLLTLLWAKAFPGSTLPAASYRPEIANPGRVD